MTMMIYHDKQESSKPEVPMAQDIWRRTLPDNRDTPWLDKIMLLVVIEYNSEMMMMMMI